MMPLSNKIIQVLFLFYVGLMQGQTVFGVWKTIDDRTGKPKAIINIYEKNGLLFGEVVKIVEEGKGNAICEKCEGDLKGLPVTGMTIIKNGKKDDEVWKGNYLFDPQQAMTFRFKIWLNPDNSDELKVRGYLAFLYRTQTWLRHKSKN